MTMRKRTRNRKAHRSLSILYPFILVICVHYLTMCQITVVMVNIDCLSSEEATRQAADSQQAAGQQLPMWSGYYVRWSLRVHQGAICQDLCF